MVLCDPLMQYDASIQIITLYEVMIEHGGVGKDIPCNCAYAINRSDGMLGLDLD